MGRTILSWRMEVDAEIAKLSRFREYLGKEDRVVFNDLLDQCKLYSSFASGMTHSIKEVPLLVSILFGQHKRIVELEKKLEERETNTKQNPPNDSGTKSQKPKTLNEHLA